VASLVQARVCRVQWCVHPPRRRCAGCGGASTRPGKSVPGAVVRPPAQARVCRVWWFVHPPRRQSAGCGGVSTRPGDRVPGAVVRPSAQAKVCRVRWCVHPPRRACAGCGGASTRSGDSVPGAVVRPPAQARVCRVRWCVHPPRRACAGCGGASTRPGEGVPGAVVRPPAQAKVCRGRWCVHHPGDGISGVVVCLPTGNHSARRGSLFTRREPDRQFGWSAHLLTEEFLPHVEAGKHADEAPIQGVSLSEPALGVVVYPRSGPRFVQNGEGMEHSQGPNERLDRTLRPGQG